MWLPRGSSCLPVPGSWGGRSGCELTDHGSPHDVSRGPAVMGSAAVQGSRLSLCRPLSTEHSCPGGSRTLAWAALLRAASPPPLGSPTGHSPRGHQDQLVKCKSGLITHPQLRTLTASPDPYGKGPKFAPVDPAPASHPPTLRLLTHWLPDGAEEPGCGLGPPCRHPGAGSHWNFPCGLCDQRQAPLRGNWPVRAASRGGPDLTGAQRLLLNE